MGRPKGSKNGHRTLVQITCERCGKLFNRRPSEAQTARYCSIECYYPPRDMVICQGCGKEYLPQTSTHGKYCSQECMRNRVEKQCPQCHKTFFVRASKSAKYIYCSIECRRAASTSVVLTCPTCGKEFTKQASQSTQYCSYDCAYALHRAIIICAYCGKERTVKKYRIAEGVRCCSNRCATLLRMRDGFEPSYMGKKRQSGYHTDIETMTENVLIALDIPFIFEHKVHQYSVDFVLPTLGIALECDGWQHLTERGRARDVIRDAALTKEGWCVIHVTDKAIRTNAHAAISQAIGIQR